MSRIRVDLRALLGDIRSYGRPVQDNGRFGPGRIRENFAALVLWILEGDGSKDLRYPLSLSSGEGNIKQGQQWLSVL